MKRFKDDRISLEKDFKHLNKQKQLKHLSRHKLQNKIYYNKELLKEPYLVLMLFNRL